MAGGVWHPGGAFPFRPLKIGIFFGNLFVSAAFFLLLSFFGIGWRRFARFLPVLAVWGGAVGGTCPEVAAVFGCLHNNT